MAYNRKTAIVFICLMALNSISESGKSDMCGDFTEDSIVLAGFVHYEVTAQEENRGEFVGNVLFDIYSQEFKEAGETFIPDYRTQGGFIIAECDEEPHNAEDLKDCQLINRLKNEICIESELCFTNQPFILRFFFKWYDEEQTWNRKFSPIDNELRASMAKSLTEQKPILWPLQWAEHRDDEAIMGACAYSERAHMFIYVINGKDDSKNAVVYTRTLKEIRENKTWTAKEIPNTSGKKIISMFYWFLDGRVLALVIKSKNSARNTAEVYEYDPKDPNIFIQKSKNRKEYLWKCEYPSPGNSEIWVLVFMIITVAVLAITVFIVCYFFLFLMFRKKGDPIFGLRVQ